MLCKCSGKYIDIYFILKITCYQFSTASAGGGPPPSIVFNAAALASIFQKLSLRVVAPHIKDVGSTRRSSTAGPSDKDRPNPLTQISELAPQGPDAAP